MPAAQARWEDALGASSEIDWILSDQLLAHYALDGDIAGVHAGQRVNATLEGGLPRFVPGRVGAAASFDGQRFINAGTSPNLDYVDEFTLSAWLYPTAETGVIVSRASGGYQGEVGWGLYLEEGKVRLSMSTRVLDDGVAAETVGSLPLNEWHHVLVTYDGSMAPGGMRFYFDGRSVELTPLLDLVGNRLPQRAAAAHRRQRFFEAEFPGQHRRRSHLWRGSDAGRGGRGGDGRIDK